jgi:hypothetical protein
MTQTFNQEIMVFSGPIDDRASCAQSLKAAGITLVPENIQEKAEGWGLPSYTDPITAHAAGKPNSGHHINEKHPSVLRYLKDEQKEGENKTEPRPHACEHVGEPYEADPGIGWLAAYGDRVDTAKDLVEKFGWQLRLHTAKSMTAVNANDFQFQPTNVNEEELFARLEARYSVLRKVKS